MPRILPEEYPILDAMAAQCASNSEDLRKRLYEIYHENWQAVSSAIYFCEMDNLRSHDYVKKQNLGIKYISRLLKSAEQYQANLKLVKETFRDREWLEFALRKIDDGREVYEAWRAAPTEIEKHINLYRISLNSIKATKQKGRPSALQGLEDFSYQIASIYQKLTGLKFTVDDFRENGVPMPITEGQRFVNSAIPLISVKPIKDRFGYTPNNIQTACKRAAQLLKQA